LKPYALLSRLLPTRGYTDTPKRIIFIQPCCIGDVVLATGALKALRRAYRHAHITWAVGKWSRPAIENHDLLDELLDTGKNAVPVRSVKEFWQFVRQLRAGHYDLAVSLVRSPLMSLAVLLSGIPNRAGIDSAGRGFGYNIRTAIDPLEARHEGELYLEVVRTLEIDTSACYANVPVTAQNPFNTSQPYVVINPAGGNNPGMMMDVKRWLPENFAALADRLAETLSCAVVVIGGPKDGEIIQAVTSRMNTPSTTFVGILAFPQIAALAKEAKVYIGNDTGLTHYAAAAGAKTVMILGPSDPARYAPFAPNAIAAWKPTTIQSGGVASGTPEDWDWKRDGVSVEEVFIRVLQEVKNQ
jgi:ADP-heptose:LPS heptosyltransferase